jgi:aspartate carbamoyltransferase catalytic subunit
VLRSNVLLLKTMGAEVWACGPATLLPAKFDRFGVHATTSVDEAVDGADVVMMLRIQHERMHGHYIPSVREYFTLFGLTPERMRRAATDAIVMHPGPMNRGSRSIPPSRTDRTRSFSSRCRTASRSGWRCCTCCPVAIRITRWKSTEADEDDSEGRPGRRPGERARR